MSDSAMIDLLRLRLGLVSRLSLATSQLQRWRQNRMSAEMDAQRCELAPDNAAQDLQREWDEALRRLEEADCGAARCAALIAEIEQSLAETDREIAAFST
jgi:hypothetical protein